MVPTIGANEFRVIAWRINKELDLGDSRIIWQSDPLRERAAQVIPEIISVSDYLVVVQGKIAAGIQIYDKDYGIFLRWLPFSEQYRSLWYIVNRSYKTATIIYATVSSCFRKAEVSVTLARIEPWKLLLLLFPDVIEDENLHRYSYAEYRRDGKVPVPNFVFVLPESDNNKTFAPKTHDSYFRSAAFCGEIRKVCAFLYIAVISNFLCKASLDGVLSVFSATW